VPLEAFFTPAPANHRTISVTTSCAGPDRQMKTSFEIEAIVRRLWEARTRGDLEVMKGLWSKSEHLLIIGSDAREWLEGTRESIPVATAQVEEWPIEKSELLRLRAFEEGTVGWAAFEERRTNTNGRTSTFRRTMVFVLEAGSWKVVQSHFSAPVPNIETAGVELTNTLAELLGAIGTDAELLPPEGQLSGTTTLLFTDIVGSTSLSRSMGDAMWSALVKEHFETVARIVGGEGGSVVKTLGDGGMYAFQSGAAALRAAARIQRSVAGTESQSLPVRIGVHTGDVIRTGGDFLGLTVNKAARVAAAAEAGEILVSDTTAGLVSDSGFEFDRSVTKELKGLSGAHVLHHLIWKTADIPPAV
jgi:adenylate cyclase